MEDRKLLYSTAIRPAVITIIAYAVVKCAYYAVFFGETYLMSRAVASVVMVCMAFVFFVPGLTRRQMSWLVPTGMVLAELAVIPFVDYDRLVYFYLVGCALLSLLFVDLAGLLITVGTSWAVVSIYLFVFDRSLINGTVADDDMFYFAGVVAVDIVIILMCKFSVSVLETSRRNVEAALCEAQEANRAKSRFMVAMSHEIRTPMNAITGMAELALHEEMSDAARERVGIIKRAAYNLLSSVDDIFDPSKIDNVKIEDAGQFGRFDAEPDREATDPPEPDPQYEPDIPAEIAAPRFSAPDARALVTDDIKTNLEVARGLLSLYKIRVDTCVSGAAAIEAIKNNNYDLVFMDHMMPEMDGVETTRRIRELDGGDRRFKNLPIIALTANAVAGAREMFLQSGFDGFLSKPIDTAKLAAILEKWISNEKKMPAEVNAAIYGETDAGGDIVIDGVDVKLGISRTGGTVSGYLKTLEIFCGDGREKIEEIRRSMTDDDLLLYTTYIHALKSAAANIGAVRLSEAAKVLEAAGKRGDRAFINKHTSRVMADLVLVLRGADKAVAAARKETPARHTADIDGNALNETLTKLRIAMDSINPAEITAAIKELERFENAADENTREKIKNIAQNVLRGDYEAAAAALDSLTP